MRLGADGTVLAANDAALTLLGVKSGAQALGRDFSFWLPEDQCDRWRAFSGAVVQGYPASIECDIAASSGDRHPTLFHGVPLADHPDGVTSIAVAARSVSGQRQLGAAIVELEGQLRERQGEAFKARARLAEAEASRQQLAERVAALEASLREREVGADEEGRLRHCTADLGDSDAAIAEADAARRTAEANCASALADVRQLEMALEAFAARQQRITAELAAERQRVQQMSESVAASQEQALLAGRAMEAAGAALQAELEEARVGRLRLEAALQQALASSEERERDVLADRDELRTRLDEALVTCQEREVAMRELETAHGTLAAAHRAATAEHERFVSALRVHALGLDALANGVPCAGGGQDAAEGATAPGFGPEDGLA